MRRSWSWLRAAFLCLPVWMLADCSGVNALLERAAEPPGTPVVRGVQGGQARLVLISCPRSNEGAQALIDLLNYLLQQPDLVIASSGGGATLVINACPVPDPRR